MMFGLHAVERLSDPPVTRFIADAYRLLTARLEKAVAVLTPHRFCFTSLESVEYDPAGTLEPIKTG